MSIRFLAASTRYLTAAAPVVSGTPLSMAAWVHPDNITGDFGVISVGIEGDAFSFHCLELFGSTAGDPVRAASRGTSGAVVAATTSSGFSAGVWQHVAGVWSAANARAAYLNGGSKGTNTSSVSPGTFDVTKIGIRPNSVTIPMSGLIANAAVWNVALTDAEILMLALGALPFDIRPANLVAYWPIVGNNSPELNIGKTSGLDMTWTNSPTKDVHVPIRTRRPITIRPPAAGAGPVVLTVQDVTHGHNTDSPALTQANTLAVQDVNHGHNTDSPALTQANVLTIQDVVHAHDTDSPALTQANVLNVSDAIHGHVADSPTLTQDTPLVVADVVHAHNIDSPALVQANVLAVQDVVHAHNVDSPALTQANVLTVQDVVHAHIIDSILLNLPGGMTPLLHRYIRDWGSP